MTIIYVVLREILVIAKWIVILGAILSWLVAFGVLDTRNRIVWQIGDFFQRIMDPMLRPIRRHVPNFGGIDISPLILLIIIWILQMILDRAYYAASSGDWGLLLR